MKTAREHLAAALAATPTARTVNLPAALDALAALRGTPAAGRAYADPHDTDGPRMPHRPSMNLQRYVLQRGRWHLRPELLDAITRDVLGQDPSAQHRAALADLAHALVPHLRAGIYAPQKLAGPYTPATEGTESRWAALAGQEGAQAIAAQRKRWEAAHGLVMAGKHPVSGSALLVSPPGAEGHALTWLNGYGDDEARTYGDHVHQLTRQATDRTVFILGDSHNAAAQGQLKPRALTHAEAALLAATQGRTDFLADLPGAGDGHPYIEALTLGGVNLDVDSEAVHHYPSARLKIGDRAAEAHADYIARQPAFNR